MFSKLSPCWHVNCSMVPIQSEFQKKPQQHARKYWNVFILIPVFFPQYHFHLGNFMIPLNNCFKAISRVFEDGQTKHEMEGAYGFGDELLCFNKFHFSHHKKRKGNWFIHNRQKSQTTNCKMQWFQKNFFLKISVLIQEISSRQVAHPFIPSSAAFYTVKHWFDRLW